MNVGPKPLTDAQLRALYDAGLMETPVWRPAEGEPRTQEPFPNYASNVQPQQQYCQPKPQKSLAAAILLNFLFAGAGYFYLGRTFAGLCAVFLVGSMLFFGLTVMPILLLGIPAYQVLMIVDMCIIHSNQK